MTENKIPGSDGLPKEFLNNFLGDWTWYIRSYFNVLIILTTATVIPDNNSGFVSTL